MSSAGTPPEEPAQLRQLAEQAGPPPERIGPYRVLDHLGAGGMGTVYKAQAPDGRFVALKVIRAEYASNSDLRVRFQREAAAAARVPRFCTAEVLGAELEGGLLYLVTEFIDGPTLQESVAAGELWAPGDLEQLGVSMATALAAIHGAGVIHRDLKPSNVLLSRAGPRVIDFGIARALDADAALTRTGQLVGTPAFMSPEQFRWQPLTPAVDVFAWGGVVLFAGTGRYPFGSGSVEELADRVVHGDPDLTGLDGELRAVVAAALDKDPHRRPKAKDITRLLGVPTATRNPRGEVPSTAPQLAPPHLDQPRQSAFACPASGRAGAFAASSSSVAW